MQPMSRTLLAAFISAALYPIPSALAESDHTSSKTAAPEMPPAGQCIAPSQNKDDVNQLPIHIEADSAQAFGQNQATYSGDVEITQGNKNLKADTITVNQAQDNVTARGNVYFYDGQIQSVSNLAVSDLKGDRTELTDTKYQLLCQAGRGEAAYILKDGQAIYRMQDGSLTSCPVGNKSWRVKSASIDIDNNEQEATLKHTRFEILDVPVFYWPYVTVPIGDKRKTGFLYPNFSYGSDDGYEINVPIYFNLAPNYDLLTKVNVYQHRGVQLENEFRYLTRNFGSGAIKFDYLPSDRDYDDEDRWAFNYSHNGIYNSNWAFEVDYSKVSDIDYFDDLSSSIGEREDNQLLQTGEVSYRTTNSETTLLARDFQVLNKNSKPYRLLPQLRSEYYGMGLLGPLDFEMDSHISRFETDDDNRPDATRIHLEPGVVLPLDAPWGSLTTEAKANYSYYDQDLKDINNSDYKEHADRFIPEFRVNGKLKLDREAKWL
ncbi:MAG: LPS assembly protein LptD, partial [Vibrio sp.]